MKTKMKLLVSLIFIISAVSFSNFWEARTQEAADFGDPLPELTAQEIILFAEGRTAFMDVKTEEVGLGPTFNGRSCAACHAMPAVGGSSTMAEIRAGRVDANGVFYDLPGGSLFQIFSIDQLQCQEMLPADANVIAFRQAPAVFGSGLIEAIPDETILARADPEDADGDGISGRAHLVLDAASNELRVGRFGWKAQQATLLGFSGDALVNELGLTNDLFPQENAPNGDEARMDICDQVADPEDTPGPSGRRIIDELTNFMRLLGPPPRGLITAAVTRGKAIFDQIGCGRCHTPALQTGDSPIAALRRKVAPLFSDLLLHDVGTGDHIVQGEAAGSEIRTPPLWGLRMSSPFLHDGSAATIEQAIVRHAGEAAQVRQRFTDLTAAERQDLLAFLNSL